MTPVLNTVPDLVQRCHGGVRYLGERGPSIANVRRLDNGALPWIEAAASSGIQVDVGHFERLARELELEMDSLTQEVQRQTGKYTNLGSSQQVSELLFKHMGLKQARKKLTKSGLRESSDEEVLDAIKHDHPVIPLILDFRECQKLKGTYCEPIITLARRCPDGTWRLFQHFKHTRVPTGRYAMEEPNLLAIPAHSKRAVHLRLGFITRTGWKIVTVDLSQIEMRIAAHRCNSEQLIKIYLDDADVYSEFAITAFHLDPTKYQDEHRKWIYPAVNKEEHRFPAKTAVLASLYRVTAPGLLAQMPVGKGWTENKCQDLLNAFLIKFHEILAYCKIDDMRARRWLMAWDMWGRMLHTPGVKSALPYVIAESLRSLGNHPYQGGACGVFKLGMAQTHALWEGCNLQEVIHPLLPIHDELLYECREDVAEEWVHQVSREFENTVRLRVPIKTSGDIADTWGLIKK